MLETIIQAAKAGGEKLLPYFGKQLKLDYKGGYSNFCTEADMASEKVILDVIAKSELSSFNIHAEESGKTDNNSDYTIVIDPLDGTNTFSLGIPHFSVSIGIVKGQQIVAGVVYHPFLNEMYRAERGRGAYKNDKKISVNDTDVLAKATLSYQQGYGMKNLESFVWNKFLGHSKRLLTMRSPALDFCMLASGQMEGILSIGADPYDFMAGKLIVQEAGGRVVNYSGSNNPFETSFFVDNGSDVIGNYLKGVLNDGVSFLNKN